MKNSALFNGGGALIEALACVTSITGSLNARYMSNPRVFLVDGFTDEREMYAEYLTLNGFDVRAFEDPRSAIDTLTPAAPAAVVTRIRQTKGGIDGITLTEIVRRHSATRDAAIIVLTTSMHCTDHEAAARAGCDACLMLPIMPDDLLNVLRSALRSRRDAAGTASLRPPRASAARRKN